MNPDLQHENLLLYLSQEGEKKRGQAAKVCQSHKGNDHSPFGRLGKATLARAVRWEGHQRDTAHYRGAFISENIAPSIVVGFSSNTSSNGQDDMSIILLFNGAGHEPI